MADLPECFAMYPNAVEPNECTRCKHRELCKHVKDNFVPKKVVFRFIEACEMALKR